MEMIHNLVPETDWYEWSVMEEYNAIYGDERVAVLVVGFDTVRPEGLVSWCS